MIMNYGKSKKRFALKENMCVFHNQIANCMRDIASLFDVRIVLFGGLA
jgi:hypothetical protein